jgi:hypothetical protein
VEARQIFLSLVERQRNPAIPGSVGDLLAELLQCWTLYRNGYRERAQEQVRAWQPVPGELHGRHLWLLARLAKLDVASFLRLQDRLVGQQGRTKLVKELTRLGLDELASGLIEGCRSEDAALCAMLRIQVHSGRHDVATGTMQRLLERPPDTRSFFRSLLFNEPELHPFAWTLLRARTDLTWRMEYAARCDSIRSLLRTASTEAARVALHQAEAWYRQHEVDVRPLKELAPLYHKAEAFMEADRLFAEPEEVRFGEATLDMARWMQQADRPDEARVWLERAKTELARPPHSMAMEIVSLEAVLVGVEAARTTRALYGETFPRDEDLAVVALQSGDVTRAQALIDSLSPGFTRDGPLEDLALHEPSLERMTRWLEQQSRPYAECCRIIEHIAERDHSAARSICRKQPDRLSREHGFWTLASLAAHAGDEESALSDSQAAVRELRFEATARLRIECLARLGAAVAPELLDGLDSGERLGLIWQLNLPLQRYIEPTTGRITEEVAYRLAEDGDWPGALEVMQRGIREAWHPYAVVMGYEHLLEVARRVPLNNPGEVQTRLSHLAQSAVSPALALSYAVMLADVELLSGDKAGWSRLYGLRRQVRNLPDNQRADVMARIAEVSVTHGRSRSVTHAICRLSNGPRRPWAIFTLVRALVSKQQWALARHALGGAGDDEPPATTQAWQSLGIGLMQAKDFDGGLALRKHSGTFEFQLLEQGARAALDHGRLELAEELLSQVNRQNHFIYRELWQAQLRARRLSAAQATFRRLNTRPQALFRADLIEAGHVDVALQDLAEADRPAVVIALLRRGHRNEAEQIWPELWSGPVSVADSVEILALWEPSCVPELIRMVNQLAP